MLARDISGGPVINGVKCLDTGGQQVGEDIANSNPFFAEALNEILAGGQSLF